MDTNKILPVLDNAVLQEKANEFAMKGATETLKEFYSGYNSPYRKAIDEQLNSVRFGSCIELPDIIALINDSLSKEIDLIANTAVSKSFVPMVQQFLVREEKEINFSDFLKEFVKCVEANYPEECFLELKENTEHGWYNIVISAKDKTYSLTLHCEYSTRKSPKKDRKYSFLSLPYDKSNHHPTMKLSVDGVSLEMPFVKDVLQDNFVSYVARLVIAKTFITLDCDDFDDSMFPEDSDCHCH